MRDIYIIGALRRLGSSLTALTRNNTEGYDRVLHSVEERCEWCYQRSGEEQLCNDSLFG